MVKYDKLHARKTKSMWDNEYTVLYCIKETPEYYISPAVWAFCAGQLKTKKKNITLSVDLPVITDEKTKVILPNRISDRMINTVDAKEAIEYLNKLYPNHEKHYLYNLVDNGFSKYCWNCFARETNKKELSFINQEFHKRNNIEDEGFRKIREEFQAWRGKNPNASDKEYSDVMNKYLDDTENYLFEHLNIIPQIKIICENVIVWPVAFSDSTGKWWKETYKKRCPYGDAGEIYFVITDDNKIYFEVKRHY